MLAKIISGALVGLQALPVEVEVDIPGEGLPSFSLVGLPDKAVEEAKERVRSAIKNTGAEFPATRVTVNLAPADLPKSGPLYDLPIAIGMLLASGQLTLSPQKLFFAGELALDGSLRSTAGILPLSYLAKELKVEKLFVPKINAEEAAIVSGIEVYGVENLLELVHHLSGNDAIVPTPLHDIKHDIQDAEPEFDFSEIVGQESAKRAFEIAAAGNHNVFLRGTPGSGKTMLSRALPGILPRMTEDEAIVVTKIYSITGNLPAGTSYMTTRPFRSPHHTTSRVGLIGGGTHLNPGEVSLSHRGVLFLDELPEFPRSVLECLRQPLEDGVVSISRARGNVVYPASFLFVGAANPCPQGYTLFS